MLEASHRAGGWIRSEFRQEGVLEWGPNTLMAGKDWLDLVRDLKLPLLHSSAQNRRRFLWVNNQRHQLPTNPAAFLATRLLSFDAKMSVFKDLLAARSLARDDGTIAEFISTVFHPEILEKFVQPFVSGIFAGNVDELSAAACFPKLWDAKKESGSVIRGLLKSKRDRTTMISFPLGLEEIVKGLSHELGASIYLQHPSLSVQKEARGWCVQSPYGLHRFSSLVMATPSSPTASLLASLLDEESTDFLKVIRYEDVMVWNTIFKKEASFQSGFGCLVPRSEGTALLGSLWSSEVFPGRGDAHYLVSSQFFSGSRIPSRPEEFIPLLCKILGLPEKSLIHSEARRYEKAIPQLALFHRQKVEALRSKLPQGLFLAGNYLDGVGLSNVIKTSKDVAQRIYESRF